MNAKSSRPIGHLTRLTRRGDIVRATVAVVGFTLVFATGVFLLTAKPWTEPRSTAYKGDSEIRTGTILLAPNDENVCRKVVFDNASGRMRQQGSAPCSGSAAPREGLEPSQRWRAYRNH